MGIWQKLTGTRDAAWRAAWECPHCPGSFFMTKEAADRHIERKHGGQS